MVSSPHCAARRGQAISTSQSHALLFDRHVDALPATRCPLTDASCPGNSSHCSVCRPYLFNPNARICLCWPVRCRAPRASFGTPTGPHAFSAAGTTDYLTICHRTERVQRMARHSNARATGLSNRRNNDISVGKMKPIGI